MVYNRTTVSLDKVAKIGIGGLFAALGSLFIRSKKSDTPEKIEKQ